MNHRMTEPATTAGKPDSPCLRARPLQRANRRVSRPSRFHIYLARSEAARRIHFRLRYEV